MEVQPRLRVGPLACGRPGAVPNAQARQAIVTRAMPPRRTNTSGPGNGREFLNYNDDLEDDLGLAALDNTVRYGDYLRNDGPAYTSYGRKPRYSSSNSLYNFNDPFMDAGFQDQYETDLLESLVQIPATLSDEKRFLNGKQIPTNNDITQPLLRVIGEKKEPIGMKTREDALQMALEQSVDLILINPQEAPPVARLMEWSKFKFEIEQGEKAKKAKAVVVETKEVRLSPKTDDHDLATKVKTALKFLDKGNKVKLVMKFEGRQLQHKETGKEVLMKFIGDLGDSAKVEGPLSFKGAMYQVVLTPGKAGAGSGAAKPAASAPEAAAPTAVAPPSVAPPRAAAPMGPPAVPPPSVPPPSIPMPPMARPPMPPGAGPVRPGAPPPPMPPARPAGAPMAPPPLRGPPGPAGAPGLQPLRPPMSPPLQPASRPATNYQPVSSRQP